MMTSRAELLRTLNLLVFRTSNEKCFYFDVGQRMLAVNNFMASVTTSRDGMLAACRLMSPEVSGPYFSLLQNNFQFETSGMTYVTYIELQKSHKRLI
jgi:hypothetical protein